MSYVKIPPSPIPNIGSTFDTQILKNKQHIMLYRIWYFTFFFVKSLSFPYPYRVPALSRHHSSRHFNSSYPFLSKENLSVCYIMHLVSLIDGIQHTLILSTLPFRFICALSLSLMHTSPGLSYQSLSCLFSNLLLFYPFTDISVVRHLPIHIYTHGLISGCIGGTWVTCVYWCVFTRAINK